MIKDKIYLLFQTLFFRFTSRVQILNMEYANSEELTAIYIAYLNPILHHRPVLQRHPVWGSLAKVQQLALSMIQVTQNITKHW